jgi:hypothetical protein
MQVSVRFVANECRTEWQVAGRATCPRLELGRYGYEVRLKPPFDGAQGGPEVPEGPDTTYYVRKNGADRNPPHQGATPKAKD